ncbi:hypothetical protein OG897_09215 [Streptomyces sp. NBC_00237]|uniref:hypothetical protein n=1 Tax=Streptomyces sp. NBC_00237 TaxID=2975687 RepID=UPI002250251F|nr:hypothetical protein [Streptomyces sp. NBC_00237]MCX5201628.1 hypothetical protein [Streptomyces sp. NBC_00237]
MVNTRSRRYEAAARRTFWSGIVLLLLGLAALVAARTDGARPRVCDPGCRPAESTAWEIVRTLGAAGAGLGALLGAVAVLMVTLRRPPAPPLPSSPSAGSGTTGPE